MIKGEVLDATSASLQEHVPPEGVTVLLLDYVSFLLATHIVPLVDVRVLSLHTLRIRLNPLRVVLEARAQF